MPSARTLGSLSFPSRFIVTALIVWSATAVETSGTTQNGGKIALNILSGIFHPDTGLLFNLTVQGVPYLLLENRMHCISRHCCGRRHLHSAGVPLRVQPDAEAHCFYRRIIIMAVRTVPAFIYGLMFIRVTGPGAFAGLLTMSLCSVGMVSKMYIEAIEDLDVRVLESLGRRRMHHLAEDPLWHPASADAQLRFHRHLPF
jgi:phosphonate transport system permease protein